MISFFTLNSMWNIKNSITIVLLLSTVLVFGQQRVTTVGLQFKPILPSTIMQTGQQNADSLNSTFQLDPKFGYGFGMIVRRGLSKMWSIEAGINFVQRNYNIAAADTDSIFSETDDFRFIGYEFPVSALIYIQLGEELFMNASLGGTLDYYPSDVQTAEDNFSSFTDRTSLFQASLNANVGFEYRTPKSGYFYLGASLHTPVNNIAVTRITNTRHKLLPAANMQLSGNYLTLDLRYFFHEDPDKKGKNKKKK